MLNVNEHQKHNLGEKVSCEWLTMSVHIHECTRHKHAHTPPRHTGPGQAEPLSATGGERGEGGGSPEALMHTPPFFFFFFGKIYITPNLPF